MADDFKDLYGDGEYEIIELYNEATDKDEKFFWIDTVDFKGKQYAVFQPAEEIDDIGADEVLIQELITTADGSEIIPIEDEKLLDDVYREFLKGVVEYVESMKENEACSGVCEGCSGCADPTACDKNENCPKK